ncbi:MAG TPA: ribosome-associated translation inhibitor RaiA [Spirochaetes bacterium]|nr:ribosome-associated translation inhibitor RaiA [Spirochaetota bacterium]
MKIIITGRRMEISPSLKDYVEKKLEKLEKYFNQLIDIHVVMNVEKLDHMVDVMVNGDGVQFYALEKSGDMYSSIDLIVDKIEKQIVRFKEKQSGHKVVPLRMMDTVEINEREGVDVALEQVSNKPKTETEAYLEMKLLEAPYLLFKKGAPAVEEGYDYANRNYALLFRSGNALKMIEVPLKMIETGDYNTKGFIESDVKIIKDSNTNPELSFEKKGTCEDLEKYTIPEALKAIMEKKKDYLPFFNAETHYLSVVFRNGKQYGVMVPAF